MDVAKDIHQNHVMVLLSRCFVDVDHVHIKVHTFIFTSLFDVDVVNGIVNLQFECCIFELVLLDEWFWWMDIHPRGGGTLGICGWGCAARTLEALAYTRANFSWILLPYTRVNSPNHS